MEVTIEPRADHLLVVARGPYGADEARGGLARMIDACRKLRLERILVDGRGITTPVSIMHRYDLATQLAEMGGTAMRMAIVVSPENMFTKTFEDTATNRGANVRTTASMDEALAYLGIAMPAGG